MQFASYFGEFSKKYGVCMCLLLFFMLGSYYRQKLSEIKRLFELFWTGYCTWIYFVNFCFDFYQFDLAIWANVEVS
jgi:hypothetical protein